MDIGTIVALIVGAVPSYYLGRARAEWGRARADAKSAVDRRHAYRKD